jgi:hypothetical protein
MVVIVWQLAVKELHRSIEDPDCVSPLNPDGHIQGDPRLDQMVQAASGFVPIDLCAASQWTLALAAFWTISPRMIRMT